MSNQKTIQPAAVGGGREAWGGRPRGLPAIVATQNRSIMPKMSQRYELMLLELSIVNLLNRMLD